MSVRKYLWESGSLLLSRGTALCLEHIRLLTAVSELENGSSIFTLNCLCSGKEKVLGLAKVE